MNNGKKYKKKDENEKKDNIKKDTIKKDNIEEKNWEEKDKKEEKICNYDGCKRKLKLTDQPCKCENTFCKLHKFPEDHKCDFNYKCQKLKNQNIKALECRPIKILKIN